MEIETDNWDVETYRNKLEIGFVLYILCKVS